MPTSQPTVPQRLTATVQLVRPGNALMAAVGAVIGALVAAGPGAWATVGLAALATALVTAGGNALNDVVDREIDRSAHPERPIPTGRLTARAAAVLGGISFALALGIGAWISIPVLAIVAGAEALLVGYELFGKATPLLGNVVVAALVAATFAAGALAMGELTAPVGFLAGLSFLANVAREAWKDIEDADHDRGRATLARTWGKAKTSRLAQGLTLGAVGLSPLPLVVGFGGWPYAVIVGLADIVFVAAVLSGSAPRAQRLSKAAMVVALAAFALGGIR